MKNIEEKLEKLGIAVPEILLPAGADLEKWAVIACDQFTHDRSYWEKVKINTQGSPSTGDMILPEIYIHDSDCAFRIAGIHKTMRSYLDAGVFNKSLRGFIYIERETPYNLCRRGLVAAIDLEQYDWQPQARPLIRATEGTVTERLPVRMEIRRDALLEIPHVLLMINDDTDSFLKELGERAKKTMPVYQGKLMFNSGSVKGWFVDEENWPFLASKLEELAARAPSEKTLAEKPFLFAVGDGNHSLAGAKGIWEEYKQNALAKTGSYNPCHPFRYALVEIENIHDPAIQFEPIHRVIYGIDMKQTVDLLSALPDFSSRNIKERKELVKLTGEKIKGNRFGIIYGSSYLLIETSASGVSAACLQPLLDKAIASDNLLSIDYIHGEEELFSLASSTGKKTCGILLPPVRKTGFFKTIDRIGPLPKKSFSMGEACEKRFYIECRKLV